MSGEFNARLAALNPPCGGARTWWFVPYDQLSDAIGGVRAHDPTSLGIVMIESAWKASQRPYHRHKLALLLSNHRHFALEQAARGVRVEYLQTRGPYAPALERFMDDMGVSLRMMEAAEWELRDHLAPLVNSGRLCVVPHEGFVTTEADFAAAGPPGGPWRMDAFYRAARRRTGVLMNDGHPAGGRFSFDGENRKAWRGTPPPPTLPTYAVDAITEEVIALVRRRFEHHPGRIREDQLPSTLADANAARRWFVKHCLPLFGPYQDAMSERSSSLFHARLSALIHLHRVLPRDLIQDALDADIPLPSKEGFVRQVLGWREYVRHVHRATDGFRTLAPARTSPGDGGWSNWTMEAWPQPTSPAPGGADPHATDEGHLVPPAYWGHPSGLRCLDTVVSQVWDEAYGHHITRLMVLSNLGTLLGVSPRALTDWFWVAYADAYDWVVEPNVLGMGTHSIGPRITTKPYVCGASYISKMGDFCRGCAFDPRSNCPITAMYWDFLARNEADLRGNPRMVRALWGLAKRSAERRQQDGATTQRTRDLLMEGKLVHPDALVRGPAASDERGDRRGD